MLTAFFRRRARFRLRTAVLAGFGLLAALLCIEAASYGAAASALSSLIGASPAWRGSDVSMSDLLALGCAFVDLAGLARLTTRERGWKNEPRIVKLLTAAWLGGSAINAALMWFYLTVAVGKNQGATDIAVVDRSVVLAVAPILLTAVLWLTRVSLIWGIGELGERLLAPPETEKAESGPPVAIRLVNDLANGSNARADTGRQARLPSPSAERMSLPNTPTPSRAVGYSGWSKGDISRRALPESAPTSERRAGGQSAWAFSSADDGDGDEVDEDSDERI